jgi:hypothetical protein
MHGGKRNRALKTLQSSNSSQKIYLIPELFKYCLTAVFFYLLQGGILEHGLPEKNSLELCQ